MNVLAQSMAGQPVGNRTIFQRTCPFCEANCGVNVEVDMATGTVAGVRGDKEDPFSKGFICAKAYAATELHHDKDIVRTPLLRRGRDFEPIDWKTALEIAGERLADIKKSHGGDATSFYVGNPTAHNPGLILYGPLLVQALGTRQLYTAGSVDHISKVLAGGLMFGDCAAIPVPDVDRTDFLVIQGGNPAVSGGSLLTAPGMPWRIKAIRERGGRVVVIDPRRSETAEFADTFISIRPGSDALFLFGIIDTLFAEGLVEPGRAQDYVRSGDVARLQALAAAFPAESIAAKCGVDAGTIKALARDFAKARSATWYGRTGTSTQLFGSLASWLQDCINLLTGNLDQPGGAMFPQGVVPAILYADKYAGDVAPFGRYGTRVKNLPELSGILPTAALADEILTPGKNRVRALITMAGNPVISHPNSARMKQALEALDFMVSVDIYVNETTRYADLILPSPPHLAHADFAIFSVPYMVRNFAKWSAPVFDLEAGQPHDWEIFLHLAAKVSGVSSETMEEMYVDAMLDRFLIEGQHPDVAQIDRQKARHDLGDAPGPDRIYDLLIRTGRFGDGFGLKADGLNLAKIKDYPHGLDLGPMESQLPRILSTPDHKIDLVPEVLAVDVMRLRESVAEPEDPNQMLLIGRRHVRSSNSWMANLNVLAKGKDRCTMVIHPQDADRIGLKDGGLAKIATHIGALTVPVEVSDEIKPGVVSVPHGWGHDDPNSRLSIARKHVGVNINAIIDEQQVDRPSMNAVLNGVPVTVTQV